MRIFVVEDEEPARKGLIQMIRSLSPQSAVVGQAADGREALRRIVKLKPDLVFTDIRIPWLDGLALIAAIHAHDVHPEFVIVSAHADFAYAKSAIALGVGEYLVKPLMAEELAACLRAAELRHRTRSRAKAPAEDAGSTTPAEAVAATPETASAKGRKAEGTAPSAQRPHPAGRPQPDELPEPGPDLHPAVRKALKIIETDYSGAVVLEALAQSVHVTPEYFSQLFHRSMGVSFSAYLKRYRIRIACGMLAEGGVKVQQVAEAVGYPDPKYFARVFREIAGATPTEYQTAMRSD